MIDKNCDKLWKIRSLSDNLNDTYAKFYNPSEHLGVDKVIVLFKGRVTVKQYIPKEHKCFGIKIYKLCDSTVWLHLQYECILGKGW
jgi:hypothetical protein